MDLKSRSRPARVLIVDDSASVREALATILRAAPGLDVVGTAPDAVVAWQKIKDLAPDVITLDVEMPRLDGVSFLERLMTHYPIPVVMVSSMTARGCATTLRALELGAVDFVAKPKLDVVRGLELLADELADKLRAAARARVGARRVVTPRLQAGLIESTYKVVAIGASTGGTEALREVLSALPPDAPGIVVVQHMPPLFTRSFAERLDGLSQIRVKEAEDGDRILPGHALIAPGGKHLKVQRSGASFTVEVFDGAPVNRHKPSVDVLFHSCALRLGASAVGVILTGMGDDGARGLAAMRKSGAHTISQDEATSVVFGMPREAIERGGAEQVLPLQRIPSALLAA